MGRETNKEIKEKMSGSDKLHGENKIRYVKGMTVCWSEKDFLNS